MPTRHGKTIDDKASIVFCADRIMLLVFFKAAFICRERNAASMYYVLDLKHLRNMVEYQATFDDSNCATLVTPICTCSIFSDAKIYYRK